MASFTARRGCPTAIVSAIAVATAGGACAEDRVIGPMGSSDGGVEVGAADARPTADGTPQSSECDMTGRWIVAQVVFARAAGAEQKTVNWFYHQIEQHGADLTITDSLNCGFRVTGTTTVTLSDDTLEALAVRNRTSVGRAGRAEPTEGGCALSLERTYNVRGADRDALLYDHWQPGDAPVALSSLPAMPTTPAQGMEDWDGDGMDGISLQTGLGGRYVAQRDWNEHAGVVPAGADLFGGEGVVVVTWDAQEGVSNQTPLLLRSTADPINPGRAWYARVGDQLEVVTGGARPELQTCKNVQALALATFENP